MSAMIRRGSGGVNRERRQATKGGDGYGYALVEVEVHTAAAEVLCGVGSGIGGRIRVRR